MELSCTENMSSVNFARKDAVIFGDRRVIENLLRDEPLYIPSRNYFEEVQDDIRPYMRNVVATWMMEVIFKFSNSIFFVFKFASIHN